MTPAAEDLRDPVPIRNLGTFLPLSSQWHKAVRNLAMRGSCSQTDVHTRQKDFLLGCIFFFPRTAQLQGWLGCPLRSCVPISCCWLFIHENHRTPSRAGPSPSSCCPGSFSGAKPSAPAVLGFGGASLGFCVGWVGSASRLCWPGLHQLLLETPLPRPSSRAPGFAVTSSESFDP